ncbi:hypothetical protein P8452_04232 [Trifolium repens]|nr:hypothetical protein P8452_04232 [Trifolium repens]
MVGGSKILHSVTLIVCVSGPVITNCSTAVSVSLFNRVALLRRPAVMLLSCDFVFQFIILVLVLSLVC